MDDAASMIVKNDDGMHLRYDQISCRQAAPGLVYVEFYWLGQLTYTLPIDCDLSAGQAASVSGLSGRIGLTVTDR